MVCGLEDATYLDANFKMSSLQLGRRGARGEEEGREETRIDFNCNFSTPYYVIGTDTAD